MSTCCRIYNPIQTYKIDIREDPKCDKYLSRSLCTDVDWTSQMESDLWGFLFSMHFYLLCLWLRRWSGFWCWFCTLITVVPETTLGLLSNTVLLLSIDSKLLVPFQYHLIPCDSEPLHLFQFCHFWRQIFVIEVSDLYFFPPSFSTSDNQASISSDQFPCHTIPIRFWVDQTHEFSIYTNFPGYRQVGSLSQTIEFHPISYRVPEHHRCEEW